MAAIAERFMDSVLPEALTGCWLWTRSCGAAGYGQFYPRKGPPVGAHRFSYELCRGPIPDGQCVLHRCDNRACCNPDHLFLGSKRDNAHDMLAKGRDGHGCLPGESNPRAKLTEDAVRTIRSSRDTVSELARRFGVTRTAVRLAKQGKTWRAA